MVGAIAGGVIGNQFGKGGGKVASTLAGAVVGGIVGNEIGRSLDARDRELPARPSSTPGSVGPRPSRAWRNPDNGRYGEVIPEETLPSAAARRLPRLHAPGLHRRPPASHAGTACRNPDGTWTHVG